MADKAIAYYVFIYDNRSPRRSSSNCLKANFEKACLDILLSLNYLDAIEEAAAGVNQRYAVRRSISPKLSELNQGTIHPLCFARMSRHRAVDFLIKAYPKDNSEIAANHLEKYLSPVWRVAII